MPERKCVETLRSPVATGEFSQIREAQDSPAYGVHADRVTVDVTEHPNMSTVETA